MYAFVLIFKHFFGGGGSPGTPVSSVNKTDHHDIAEILLKVALITTTMILLEVPI